MSPYSGKHIRSLIIYTSNVINGPRDMPTKTIDTLSCNVNNFHGALLMSLNQATVFELSDSYKKCEEADLREAAANRRPSLIAKISM